MAGIASSFRIVAACQRRGKLNSLLSMEMTARDDGTFEMAGLTQGTYLVQAARDGIWVSQPQTLQVSAGTLPDLILEIPQPGQAMDLRLVDVQGKPLRGATVTLSQPEGPLTDALWPKTLIVGGDGNLHLEGLGVGQVTVTVFAPVSDQDRDAQDQDEMPPIPLSAFVLDIPPFTAEGLRVQKTIVCGPATP